MFCDTQELDKLCLMGETIPRIQAFKKCAWRESNPRQTRFRKPPLYPTELQAHNLSILNLYHLVKLK